MFEANMHTVGTSHEIADTTFTEWLPSSWIDGCTSARVPQHSHRFHRGI